MHTIVEEYSLFGRRSLYLILGFTIIGMLVMSVVVRIDFKIKSPLLLKKRIQSSDAAILDRLQKNISYSEIAILYFRRNKDRRFSKFRCSGSQNDIKAWEDRLCLFYNTCYNQETGRFYYFRFPSNKTKPIFYDSRQRMLFEFSANKNEIKFVALANRGNTPWGPIVTGEAYPTSDFVKLRKLHYLMQTSLGADNIAHGLWEDLGSISYSMERMNIVDHNIIIMHLGSIPNTDLFRMYHQSIIPALTQNPMVEFYNYVLSFKNKYICFDRLLIGGQLNVFPKPLIKENNGREALFYNWRSKLIKYHGFDPAYVPKKHKIVITKKSHSIWTHSKAKIHRAIANLEEVEAFVKAAYPEISTEVVEWHTIPFKNQIEKLLNTTILITPCGAVSLIIPLLPHGAHAIVMDYYVTVAAHGFQQGESGSMDGAFLNHIPHVHKQYYQIYNSTDYSFDYVGAVDAREHASIIVNMPRLQLLIDKALEEMEP